MNNNKDDKIKEEEGEEEEDRKADTLRSSQEIAAHLPHWKEGIKIDFWAHVSIREVNETKCKSVQELFARWKIVPKWKSIDDLFYESLRDFFPEHKNKSGVDLELAFGSLTTYLDSMLKHVFGGAKGKVNPIASKTKEEVCNKLQEYANKLPEKYRSLFPTPFGYHLQNLYMALSQSNRDKWSERTWDNIVYANVFHRYFIDDFDPVQKSDQSVSDYLPTSLRNSVAPDLVFLSDRSPFLISEWEDLAHASNHTDLTKIVETKRGVLLKRSEQYLNSTNYVYGVLGGGEKLTLFRMEHDRAAKLYDCYFVSDSQDDLCTTTFSFENIATILRINIILMIGGKLQKLGVGKRGAEKSSTSPVTTATPDKIDNSNALKSTVTTKKRNIKKCRSMTDLQKTKSCNGETDAMSRDFAKKLLFGTTDTSANTTTTNTNVMQDEGKKKSRSGSRKKPTEAVEEDPDPSLIGKKLYNNKYTITKKLTSFVYIVSHWDNDYVAKFNVTSKDLAKEEKILAELSNRFLKPIESFKMNDKVRCLILPYVRSVEWKDTKDFTERAFAIISAINELHEKNIAHSDIKYSNVICGREGTYLIDFDLALRMNDLWQGKFNGTFGYRAPEAMRYGRLSLKMDIYSYGILLFELASFESIYDNPLIYDDNEEQMAANVRVEIQKMGLATSWHAKLVALINKCMTEDLDKRPTAKAIMEDPFFNSARNAQTKEASDKKQRSVVKKPFQDVTNTWQNSKFV